MKKYDQKLTRIFSVFACMIASLACCSNSSAFSEPLEDMARSCNKVMSSNTREKALLQLLSKADKLSCSGQFSQSQVIYKEAIETSMRSHNSHRVEVPVIMNRYAIALEINGKMREAQQVIDEAVELRCKATSKDNIDMCLANNQGDLCFKREDFECAAKNYGEAVRLQRQIFANSCPKTQFVCKLMISLIRLKRYPEVKRIAKQFFSRDNFEHDDDSLDAAMFQKIYADSCAAEGDYPTAHLYYHVALTTLERTRDNHCTIALPTLGDEISPAPSVELIEASLAKLPK